MRPPTREELMAEFDEEDEARLERLARLKVTVDPDDLEEARKDPKVQQTLENARKRSPEADRIVQQIIVTQGMSYERAVRWCENQAKIVAQPYLEVAAELRAELEKVGMSADLRDLEPMTTDLIELAERLEKCDYGDPYTKRTCLWGEFNTPVRTPVEATEGSKMHLVPPGPERQAIRSEMTDRSKRSVLHRAVCAACGLVRAPLDLKCKRCGHRIWKRVRTG